MGGSVHYDPKENADDSPSVVPPVQVPLEPTPVAETVPVTEPDNKPAV